MVSVRAQVTFGIYQLLILFLCQFPVRADTVPPAAPNDSSVNLLKMSEQQIRFSSFRELIVGKCLSCHQLGGSASNFSGYLSSEVAWVQATLVVPGRPDLSLLYKYLIGSGFKPAPLGTMPLGGTLSAAELAIVKDWIERIDLSAPTPSPSSGPASPTPSVSPSPNPGSGKNIIPSQSVPRIGDRFYVKSVLDDVFGPSAQPITNKLVLYALSLFGGICDQMGEPPASDRVEFDFCSNVDVSIFSASVLPPSNASRAAQTMKACNALCFNDTTLQYAIQAATQKTDLSYLKTSPQPSRAEIVTAYNLFSLGAPPIAATALDRLLALAVASQNPSSSSCPSGNPNCYLDPWRYTFLTLCYDPMWQVN